MKLTKKRKIAMLLIPAIAAGVMTTTIAPITHAFADDNNTTASAASSDSSSSSSASSSAAAGSYSSLQANAILATAYHDGYNIAVGTDRGKNQKDQKAADKAFQTFVNNVNTIINVQTNNHHTTFGAVGNLIGPVGLSGGSSTNALAATTSVNKQFLTNNMSGSSTPSATGLGMQYYKFGLAYQNLIKKARTVSPSSMSGSATAKGLSAVAGTVAKLGTKVLNDFSPAPVILAFLDSSKLNSPDYAKNHLVGLINDTPVAKQAVEFLGDTVPGTNLPMSIMIMLSCVIVSLGINLLLVFFNGRNFGMSFRKMVSRVIIVSVAIPLAAEFYDFGLNAVSQMASGQATSANDEIVSKNLDVADWAKSACFGLPNNMTLTVTDGQFVFGEDQIKAINLYSARQAGVISDSEYNNGDVSEATINKVAKHMSSSVGDDNNTSIGWRDTVRSRDGQPYYTDTLNKLANSLGANQEIKTTGDDGISPQSAGYLSYEGLYSTDGGKSFTMDSSDSPYGLSPVSAYNLVGSTFSQDGIKVNSNINNPSVPTVAIGVDTYGAATNKGKHKMDPIVSAIISLVMLFAGFSALARIIASGFGGMFKGGLGSAVGSAAGAGELLGGIVAVIGGVLGLSILIVFMQGVMDYVYGTIYEALDDTVGKLPIVHQIMTLGDTLRKIPVVGSSLAAVTDTATHLVDTIVCLIAFPPLVKIPIDAFGNWIANIPDFFSAKAAEMESRFTGDYRTGGMHSTGALNQAVAKQGANLNARKQAAKAGMAMMAGAGIKSILDKKNSKDSAKDLEKQNTDSKGDDTKQHDKDASEKAYLNDVMSVKDTVEKGNQTATNDSSATNSADESVLSNDTAEVDQAFGDADAAANAGANDADGESVAGDEVTGDTVNAEESSVDNEVPDDSEVSSEQSVAGDIVSGDETSTSVEQAGDVDQLSDADMRESVAGDDEGAAVDAADSVDSQAQEGEIADADGDQSVADATNNDAIEDAAPDTTGIDEGESVAQADADASDVKNIAESSTGDSVASDNSRDGDSKSTNISSIGDSQSVSDENTQEGDNTADSVESTEASAEVSQEANTSVQPGTAGDTASVANTDTDNSERSSVNMASTMMQGQSHQIDADVSRRDSAVLNDGQASAGDSVDATTQAVSDKANSFVQKIAGAGRSAANNAVNNSVMRNIVGASSGEVTAKEQFAMGAAHTAAAVVGAQGITQSGVDQINRRNGRPDSSSSSAAQKPGSVGQRPSSHNVDAEMAARAMEARDREQDANNFIRSIRNRK